MSRSQNQLLKPGTQIKVIPFFGGGLSLYSVLFKSTLNNAKLQQNWPHGFRSLSTAADGLRGARCLCMCNNVGELYGAIQAHS